MKKYENFWSFFCHVEHKSCSYFCSYFFLVCLFYVPCLNNIGGWGDGDKVYWRFYTNFEHDFIAIYDSINYLFEYLVNYATKCQKLYATYCFLVLYRLKNIIPLNIHFKIINVTLKPTVSHPFCQKSDSFLS